MLKIVVDFTLINPIMKWFVKRCCFCSFWGHLLRFCFAIFHFWGGSPRSPRARASPRARRPARARGVFGLVGDLSRDFLASPQTLSGSKNDVNSYYGRPFGSPRNPQNHSSLDDFRRRVVVIQGSLNYPY